MDISDRIKALKYYGTGDEGVELFQATCGLCYQMTGLGQSEKAETLYQWAKELADASLADAEEYDWKDDFVHGRWDYN